MAKKIQVLKELVTVKVADLIPYENNPRKNDNAVPAVIASMEEVGYITPIVVDENMTVLAGHTRLKGLIEKGVEEVPVIMQRGMTEEEKKKYRLLDNKVFEQTSWDFGLLKDEVEDLTFSFDFGFDEILQKGENLEKVKKDRETKESNSKICTCPRCGTQWEE